MALVVVSAGAAGSVISSPIGNDPYSNGDSQHKTQLEADSFGFGNTIVGTFQTGRFFDGGASNLAWSTSTNGGHTWTTGVLPHTTVNQGGPWGRISDPSVAYDPAHGVWLINGLAFENQNDAITVSRSTDGGLTWGDPVIVESSSSSLDKNWITCDTWAASPHYGNCYAEWDDNGSGNLMQMSTSTDGGLTWGPTMTPADFPSGLGGQPVVQPDGTVVVPYSENFGGVAAFRSTDGGATWTSSVFVGDQITHGVAAGLRDSPLPTAEVDGGGKVYVAWHDCRFRTSCASNDIVMSTSTNGQSWTAVTRIPIDATTSTVDHFLPGLGVDPTSSGATARLALGYYYYPVSNCTTTTCQLTEGFVSSHDGGATWSAPKQLTGPMNVSWIASTSQGRMVGDYQSASFAGGRAHPVFATAKPPAGAVFAERAASASFDVTVDYGVSKTRHDKVRFRPHNRPEDPYFPRMR